MHSDVETEEVLRILGPNKRYQICHYVWVFLSLIPVSHTVLGFIFIGKRVPQQCSPLSNQTIARILQDNSIPSSNVVDVSVVARTCNSDVIVTTMTGSQNLSVGCLDGFDFGGLRETSVVSEFGLVCDRVFLSKLPQILFLTLQALVTIVIPLMADRLGRRPLLISVKASLLIITLAAAFSRSEVEYTVLKAISGPLTDGISLMVASMGLELSLLKDRRMIGFAYLLTFTVGGLSLAVIGFGLRNMSWRTIQYAMTAGSLVVFVQIYVTDESLRWLFARGRIKEAARLVRKIARFNGIDLSKTSLANADFLQPKRRKTTTDNSERKIDESRTVLGLPLSEGEPDTSPDTPRENGVRTFTEGTGDELSSGRTNRDTDETIGNEASSDDTTNNSSGPETSVAGPDTEEDTFGTEASSDDTTNNPSGSETSPAGPDIEETIWNEASSDDTTSNPSGSETSPAGPDAEEKTFGTEASEDNTTGETTVPAERDRIESMEESPVLASTDREDTLNTEGRPEDLVENDLNQPGCCAFVRDKRLLCNTVILVYLGFVVGGSYYTLYLTSSALVDDIYLNFAVNVLSELPAAILYIFSIDSIGRKKTLILFLSISVVFLTSSSITRMFAGSSLQSVLLPMFGFLGKTGIAGGFLLLVLYAGELFPTTYRLVGLGITLLSSRVGSIGAPLIDLVAAPYPWLPASVIAGLSLIAIAVTFPLPETKGKVLPQTLADMDELYKK